MKRNTITIIEVIIILCVIVVAVRGRGHHKEIAIKTVHNISRPTVNKPHSKNSCPKCGSNIVIPEEYPAFVSSGINLIKAKRCKKCNWHILTCPRCGSNDFIEIPSQPSTIMPEGYMRPRANCKKCGWGS